MAIGDFLIRNRLVSQEELDLAMERQKVAGGLLGDNLIALGFIGRETLLRALHGPPAVPKSITDTGLDSQFLINLLLKCIYVLGLESGSDLAQHLRLPLAVVESLLSNLKKLSLVEVLGATAGNLPVMRYSLTNSGKNRALDALVQSGYVGPAPVPLDMYLAQVERQCTTHERIDAERLTDGFSHLVLDDDIVRRFGPAVNSGKAILIYGPPGNGKTSISEAIGRTFTQAIHIPYCIEVDGQVIKIYDPTVHRSIQTKRKNGNGLLKASDAVDPRWVCCQRPVIITGGELTLEMLDLNFDSISKYYEAPPQMKALGGIFIIDDFGRQLVSPRDLLNRWIIPLEKKVDYLTIHTGKKFEVPFDELVIFSTNIPPKELMDAALLRRVQYKIRLDPPSRKNYEKIFNSVCKMHQLDLPDGLLSYLIEDFYPSQNMPLAAFHPKFILEHVVATCQYLGEAPTIRVDLVTDALSNLIVSESAVRPDKSMISSMACQ